MKSIKRVSVFILAIALLFSIAVGGISVAKAEEENALRLEAIATDDNKVILKVIANQDITFGAIKGGLTFGDGQADAFAYASYSSQLMGSFNNSKLTFALTTGTPVEISADESVLEITLNKTDDYTEGVEYTFYITITKIVDNTQAPIELLSNVIDATLKEGFLAPTLESVRAELRPRDPEDSKKDIRFIFQVNFNDSFIEYNDKTYGPNAEGYQIDSNKVTIEILEMGISMDKDCSKIWKMTSDSHYQFTMVITGIEEKYFYDSIKVTPSLAYHLDEESNTLTGDPIVTNVQNLIQGN